MLYNNQEIREGRKSVSSVKATASFTLSLKAETGRLALKAFAWGWKSSLLPFWLVLCPSFAMYLKEALYSHHPVCCQELHSRVSSPCQWSKTTNKEGSLLEVPSVLMTYIHLFWGQLSVIWFQDVSSVATQSSAEVHSFHTEVLLHRGSSGVADGPALRAKLPGFKSQLCPLLVMRL